MKLLTDFARGLQHFLYPGFCQLCEASLGDRDEPFCPSCAAELVSDPHRCCPRCTSSAGEFENLSEGCLRCRDDRFAHTAAIRMGTYEDIRRDAILRCKSSNEELLAESLGWNWANCCFNRFAELAVEVIVPVPLHWWRRLRRGYNQSEAIATGIARRLNLPMAKNALRRIRNTPNQTTMTSAQRRENVKGAFRAVRPAAIAGKRVLVVDDVLTTGTTVSESAKALMKGGAKAVVVAVLGHR